MSLARILDTAERADAEAMLVRCCGSRRWVDAMLARRPFGSDDALFRAADEAWAAARAEDIREALAHHPRIGEDLDVLRQRFASTARWSASEQSSVGNADEATLLALRDGNRVYEDRFGHTFVVCATGKTAAEMLDLLRARLPNDPDTELMVAAAEQAKITRIRLQKLATG
jgi:2-oxo-4-hydroxy-4-carboxy-5-ureidoimidazoline decarboxylase